MLNPRHFRSTAVCILLAMFGCRSAPPTPVDDRLDRNVVPTAQRVTLELDPGRPTYSGRVDINLRVAVPVDSCTLNALNLDLRSLALKDSKGDVAADFALDGRGLLRIRAARPLKPGDATLSIEFTNDFDENGNGLYRYDEAGRYFLATQFEAVAAREAFPCWDEPEFKIPWTLTLVTPESVLTVANSPIEREETGGAGKTVHFRTTPPMPAYLVAIAVGPYVSVPIEGLSIPGRVITVPDRDGLAAEAARITPRILNELEAYFGRPYPYEKLDLIALPEFQGGAMENAAAITFTESLLLIDPQKATPLERRSMTTTLVHEISHMWFGDLVTMEWWDDLWLNESFANWMENKLTNELFPEFHLGVATREFAEGAIRDDSRPAAEAVRTRVGAFDNLDQLFDSFRYEKGGAVLSMMERWIGPEAFRAGAREYVTQYAWRNATAADLWRCFGHAAGRPVDEVARSFLDQPGVPFIGVDLRPDGGLSVSQRRFTPFGQDPGDAVWSIPLTFRIAPGDSSRDLRLLLSSRDTVLALPDGSPDWILPNAKGIGYCRWSVPAAMLDRMAALPPGVLSARERLDFVYNLRALLEAGRIDGGRYLDLLSSFGADPEPEVVLATIESFEDLQRTFGGTYPPEALAGRVRRTLAPALKRIGFEPRPGEPGPVTLLRPRLMLVLGDLGGDAAIRDRLRSGTLAGLDGNAGLHPSLVETGLSLLAVSGDRADLERIRTRFEGSNDPTERKRLLNALGSFRSPALVSELLHYGLNELRRSSDVLRLARGLAAQPGNTSLVLAWLTENYAAIAAGQPAYIVADLPGLAGSGSVAEMETVRTFFSDPSHQVPGTLDALSEVLDEIGTRAALRDREKAALVARLQ